MYVLHDGRAERGPGDFVADLTGRSITENIYRPVSEAYSPVPKEVVGEQRRVFVVPCLSFLGALEI